MAIPLHPIKASFSGGEFAPSLYARIDIQKYATGARKLRNFFVHPHGGISNRPGFKYIATAKNDEEQIRVVDFQFASDENYVIEFGNYYCRFYKDGAQLSKTTGTAWVGATVYSLNDITYASEVIYRCLQDHTSATFSNDLTNLKWQVDINKWIATTAYVVGNYAGVTSGTAAPTIYYCIQDHTSGTAFAVGTAWLGQTIYEIDSPYTEADLPDLRFTQSADVLFIVHPDYPPIELARYADTDWEMTYYDYLYGPFGLANDDLTHTMQVSAISGSATLTSSAAFFYPTHADSLFQLTHYIEGQAIGQAFTGASITPGIACGGTWRVISHGTWTGKFAVEKQNATGSTEWYSLREFSSAGDFNVETYGEEDMSGGALPFSVRLNVQNPSSGTWSGTLSIDLSTDPYEHIAVAEMTAYISTTQMAVTMQRPAGSTATTTNWAEGAWSDYLGWPSTVTFSQDRLIFAGSSYYPQTIWMSQTGNYYDFFVNNPMVASDSVSINLPSQKLNQINGMVSLLQLLTFSSGAEFSVGSTEGSILSPTSMQTKLNGYTGSSGVQPVVIVNRAIYVQSRGAVVRDLGYDLFTDTFTGANLSILSNHLFTGYNIVEMCYQQDPDSLVWAVRDDGILLCMTYMREQEVLAWTWCDTNEGVDRFESICSIPGDGYNEVWASVNRSGQRYIERLEKRLDSLLRQDQFFVDCGVIFDQSSFTDTYTKLLMHMDTSSFTDEKSNVITNATLSAETKLLIHFDGIQGATSGTAQTGQTLTFASGAMIDTAYKKFGTGSLQLDGIDDFVSVPDNDNWNFGTGSFTVDCWVRLNSFPVEGSIATIIGQRVTDADRWVFRIYTLSGSYALNFKVVSGASLLVDDVFYPSNMMKINTWYHCAVARSGTMFYYFLDGLLIGNETHNITMPDIAETLKIGTDLDTWLDGYIDEVRVCKGAVRWTSDFILQPYAYGQVYADTSIYKFATASAFFNGQDNMLTTPDSASWNFASANFTVECWARFHDMANEQILFSQYEDASNQFKFYKTSAHKLGMYFIDDAVVKGYYEMTSAWAGISIDTWYHLAFVRDGTTGKIFINGVSQTLTQATAFGTSNLGNFTGVLTLGGTTNVNFYGWLDEVRISNGVARWTSNFTPNSSAYTTGGDPTKTITGLTHLNGKTVAILADGNVSPQQTVSGATVTLSDVASKAIVGIPYFADLETLNIEIGLSEGSLQGRRVNISRITLRMLNSRGGWLGPDFDNLHELLGDYDTSTDTSLFTDDVKITLGQGYKDGGRFCFRQIDPLPVTILGIVPILTPGGTSQI